MNNVPTSLLASAAVAFTGFFEDDLLLVASCTIPGMCAASQTNNLGSEGSQNIDAGLLPAISAASCSLFPADLVKLELLQAATGMNKSGIVTYLPNGNIQNLCHAVIFKRPTRGLLVDSIKNSPNSHNKSYMIESKENYCGDLSQSDVGGGLKTQAVIVLDYTLTSAKKWEIAVEQIFSVEFQQDGRLA
ncbi:hypothetical protein pdam_00005738, partial [Pocillopora damicornis]